MGRRRRRQPASRRQGQLPQRLRLPGCCPRRRRPSQPWRALPPSWILRCGRCPECGRCSSVSPVQLVMGPAARTPLPHITAPCLPPPPSPAGHAATGGGGAPRRQPRGGRRRPAARPALCQPAAEQAGAGGGGVGRQPDGAQAQGAAVRLRGGGQAGVGGWGPVGTAGRLARGVVGTAGRTRYPAHAVPLPPAGSRRRASSPAQQCATAQTTVSARCQRRRCAVLPGILCCQAGQVLELVQ